MSESYLEFVAHVRKQCEQDEEAARASRRLADEAEHGTMALPVEPPPMDEPHPVGAVTSMPNRFTVPPPIPPMPTRPTPGSKPTRPTPGAPAADAAVESDATAD